MGKIREVFSGKRCAAGVYGLNFYDAGDASSAGPSSGDDFGNNGGGGGDSGGDGGGDTSTQFDTDIKAFIELLTGKNERFWDPKYRSLGNTDIYGNNLVTQDQINNTEDPTAKAALQAKFDSQANSGIQATNSALNSLGGSVGGIASRLNAIGQSGIDPAFDKLRNAQLAQLDSQQAAQQRNQSDFFSRRGISGSSAALNAQNNLSNQFGQQGQLLTSQLGLQGLQRADMANQQALSAYGQQAGLTQQQFGNYQAGVQSGNQQEELTLNALTAGIQNESLPLALKIAKTAADNQGKYTDSGGGGKK